MIYYKQTKKQLFNKFNLMKYILSSVSNTQIVFLDSDLFFNISTNRPVLFQNCYTNARSHHNNQLLDLNPRPLALSKPSHTSSHPDRAERIGNTVGTTRTAQDEPSHRRSDATHGSNASIAQPPHLDPPPPRHPFQASAWVRRIHPDQSRQTHHSRPSSPTSVVSASLSTTNLAHACAVILRDIAASSFLHTRHILRRVCVVSRVAVAVVLWVRVPLENTAGAPRVTTVTMCGCPSAGRPCGRRRRSRR